MKKVEGLIEDFKGLKSELMSIFNTRIWGTLTYVAIVAGISSSNLENFGLGKEIQIVKYIFFIFIALPLVLHTANRERARIRIANYIKKVIEPNVPGLYWENYMATWRDDKTINPHRSIDRWIHIFSLTGVYLITVIYSIIMFILWFFEKGQLSITIKIFVGIAGIIGVILFILSIFYLNGIFSNAYNDEKILDEAATKIKNQINIALSKELI
ncbi:hypothetical protein ACFLQP_00525 [Acidobacteriota bacterium]